MEEIQRYRESSDTESELAETSSGEEPGNHERRRIGAPQLDVAVQDDEQAVRFQAGGVELEGNLGLPEHALDLVRALELPKTWECERRSYRVDLGARQICRRVETQVGRSAPIRGWKTPTLGFGEQVLRGVAPCLHARFP